MIISSAFEMQNSNDLHDFDCSDLIFFSADRKCIDILRCQ